MITKETLLHQVQLELARRNYADYFKLAYADINAKLYRHEKYIADKLQKIIDGEQHFYIVEMPPQHGKSMTITQTFPSYYLTRNPDKRVMVTAYSQDLYTTFSSANRRNFENLAGPLAGLQMDRNASNEFTIKDHHGGFYATSMLGGASGRPADLLIVDDPIKNAEEAASPTIKDKIWAEWQRTFYPRLQKDGSVIVIMTRWQVDDLAGRLLQQGTLPWEVLKLPAIAEDVPDGQTDAIGRHNGEPLCPELHTLKDLLTAKKINGSQYFAAMWQQRPTVEGGNIFKRDWIHYYVPSRAKMIELGLTDKDVAIIPRHLDTVVQSWDATFKSKENDDFVAGQVWGKRGANFYLIDRRHTRMTFTQTLDAIKQTTARHPDARRKLIEDKANGSAIIDTLRNRVSGIVPVEPDGGKEVRAAAVSPLWEAGNCYLPHPLWKPGIDDMIEEMVNFPNAPHDDEVDSMTQALNNIGRHKSLKERFGI